MANYLLVGSGDFAIPPIGELKRVFVVTNNARLMTGDANGAWSQISSLTIAMMDILEYVGTVPGNPLVVLVSGTLSGVQKLYHSADGGATWTDISPGYGPLQFFRNSTKLYYYVSHATDGIVYEVSADGLTATKIVPPGAGAGGFSGAAASDSRIWYGETTTAGGIFNSIRHTASIAGGDGEDILLGASSVSASPRFSTYDTATVYGFAWSTAVGGIPIIRMDNTTYLVLVGLSGGQVCNGLLSDGTVTLYSIDDIIYRSLDLGVTASPVLTDSAIFGGAAFGTGQKFARDPSNPLIWYFIGGDGQGLGSTRYIWVSTDAGLTWTKQTLHAAGGIIKDVAVAG